MLPVKNRKTDSCAETGSAASGVDGQALDVRVCLFKVTGPGAFEEAAQKCLDLAAEEQSDMDRIEIILSFMEEAGVALAVDGKGEEAVLAQMTRPALMYPCKPRKTRHRSGMTVWKRCQNRLVVPACKCS